MIQVEWGNPQKDTIVWNFTAPWTFDEFYAAQKRADAMIETTNGFVDSIFMTSEERIMPLNAASHLRKIVAQQHKRHRYVIVVSATTFLTTLLTILGQLIPGFSGNLRHARTKAEALIMLDDLRNATPQ